MGGLKWELAKPMLYPVPNDNTGHAPKFWNLKHFSWNSNIMYVFLGYEMGFIWLTTFQVWRNMLAFKGEIYFPYNWWNHFVQGYPWNEGNKNSLVSLSVALIAGGQATSWVISLLPPSGGWERRGRRHIDTNLALETKLTVVT